MGFTYNGYAVMPDSNGPGYIIRDARDIGALIVASAPTAQAARDWIDANQPVKK